MSFCRLRVHATFALKIRKRMMKIVSEHISHDIDHWAVVLFICCVLVIVAAFIDMWTGIEAARARHEPISSRGLRKTVGKIVDYLRVLLFAVLIDTLGLFFSWYVLPYCAVLCTLGVLLIEGRSVIENSRKKKSHAADILEAVEDIIKAATRQDAEEIIKKLKEKEKEASAKK